MKHIFDLFCEYLVFPGIFIVVPRFNQFLLDRIKGTEVKFNDPEWNWQIDLAIAYFLSYILLMYRLESEGFTTGFFWMLVIPLFQIVLLSIYYINSLNSQSNKSIFPKRICLYNASLIFISILYYEIKKCSDLILSIFKTNFERIPNERFVEIIILFFTLPLLIYLIIKLRKSLKYSKIQKERSIKAFQEIQAADLNLKDAFGKFRSFESSYGIDNDIALSYLMEKISVLRKNGYLLSAMQEVIHIKESKIYNNMPQLRKEGIIMFQFDLLIEQGELLTAAEVLKELSESPVKERCIQILNLKNEEDKNMKDMD